MGFKPRYTFPACGFALSVCLIFMRNWNYTSPGGRHDNNKISLAEALEGMESVPTQRRVQPVNRDMFVHPRLPEIPMQYIPPPSANVSVIGRQFNVDPELMTSLGIPLNNFSKIDLRSVEEFVFVTGASSSHFDESVGGIAGVQKHFPGYTIYYYDLGLEAQQVVKVKGFCNVVFRKFNYGKYPAHVKTLHTSAFKPLIVHEMLLEHKSIFWMDASIRLTRNFSFIYSQIVDTDGFLQFNNTGFPNLALTNKTMLEYLPTSSIKQNRAYQGEGNCFYIHRTETLYWSIIYWWLLCALDRDCIAPVDVTSVCSFKKGGALNATCHRFDQSALGILASNLYGYDSNKYIIGYQEFKILRKTRHEYRVQTCAGSSRKP